SNSSSILSSHGSMKEEKEWRRTLACKLFEERHNSRGGEEGMDSLWEDHENSNSKKYDSGIKRYSDDEDDEDVEMSNGHLCCLQALRLSSGKMNLGMRKPNLVKISKALKGFGWLHHVKNKNGKKS
nr:neurogenic differentiation factor 1 like [Tanacetum cinerariifolium]